MRGEATLHYRCSFDIQAGANLAQTWTGVAGLIRSWIAPKLNRRDALRDRWFVQGGSPRLSGRFHVETVADFDPNETAFPDHWSVRFEHPCSEEQFRQWGTDVGLSRHDNGFRFSLATSHWLLPGYIGAEPAQPVPSAPGLVGQVLKVRHWACQSGSQRLSARPVELPEGKGADFVRHLEDPERHCSVVLVSRRFHDGTTLLDPEPLARLLAGVAIVFIAISPQVGDELDWVLQSRMFGCRDGMVRIFQPSVRPADESDARRHRYFRNEDVGSLGADRVRDMIVSGVARRSRIDMSKGVLSIEDVRGHQRERRLRELRQQAAGSNLQEQVTLLEQEISRLTEQSADLDKWNNEVASDNQHLEDERDQLREDIEKLNSEVKYWREHSGQLAAQASTLSGRLTRLDAFADLPTTLVEVIVRIEQLHSGRIVFTDSARESAQRAQINDSLKDVVAAWSCLWAIATDLHDIFFEGGSGLDLEQTFRSKTGYQLSMCESTKIQTHISDQ